jgi:hypothetical protein
VRPHLKGKMLGMVPFAIRKHVLFGSLSKIIRVKGLEAWLMWSACLAIEKS